VVEDVLDHARLRDEADHTHFGSTPRTQDPVWGLGSGRALGLVVGRGVRLASTSLAIGLALTVAVTRFASFLIHGTSPLDRATGLVAVVVYAWTAARSFTTIWRV
jgi:hypothetical protein